MIFLGIHPRPNDCAESLTVEIIHICQVQHDTFIFSDERSDRGLRPRMDEESAISRASYACFQTTVDNRIITSNPGCAPAMICAETGSFGATVCLIEWTAASHR